MGKTISVRTMMRTKYPMYDFAPDVTAMIGKAGKGFTILIYGRSGNGKSTFVAILCKLLCAYGKVYYNSVESGPGVAFQALAEHTGLIEVGDAFTIGDQDTYDEMDKKLGKNRAIFIVIDSAQAIRLSLIQWENLKKKYPNKSIIVISWEGAGDEPKGEHAKSIKFYSDIKIQVKRGQAFIDSRYGSTEPYRIPGLYEKFQNARRAENDAKLAAKQPTKPEIPTPQLPLFEPATNDN